MLKTHQELPTESSCGQVQFDCDPGYVLVGERRRWCYDSGDWNWPELGTAECIPENQYNTMQVMCGCDVRH